MIACACKCGRCCDVPESLAGTLIECPSCGSTLLVPPATRPLHTRRSWMKKAGFVLARMVLCTGIGVALGIFFWVLGLKIEGKSISKALHGWVEDALPTLQALMTLGGMVGAFIGLLYGLGTLLPPASPPSVPPLPLPSTQWPGPGRTEVTRTPKDPDP